MTTEATPRGRPPHRLDADDLAALHDIRHARAEAARTDAELDAAIAVAVTRGIPAAVVATAAGVHRVTVATRYPAPDPTPKINSEETPVIDTTARWNARRDALRAMPEQDLIAMLRGRTAAATAQRQAAWEWNAGILLDRLLGLAEAELDREPKPRLPRLRTICAAVSDVLPAVSGLDEADEAAVLLRLDALATRHELLRRVYLTHAAPRYEMSDMPWQAREALGRSIPVSVQRGRTLAPTPASAYRSREQWRCPVCPPDPHGPGHDPDLVTCWQCGWVR